jgi:hypothetical protein
MQIKQLIESGYKYFVNFKIAEIKKPSLFKMKAFAVGGGIEPPRGS